MLTPPIHIPEMLVQKMVQKVVRKVVQKVVQKMVQIVSSTRVSANTGAKTGAKLLDIHQCWKSGEKGGVMCRFKSKQKVSRSVR